MIDINKLDIKKLVEFINTDLKKNKDLSVNKWCDKVGIKRGPFKHKMKRENYIYNINERQYVYNDITSNTTHENKENKLEVVKKNDIKEISNYQDNISNIDMDKLSILLNNLDELIKLIPSNITRNITVNSNKNNVHSLRINDEIYDHIKARAKKENISISSIINKALLDYLNNYI